MNRKHEKIDNAITDRYCFLPKIIKPSRNLEICAKLRNRKILHEQFINENIIFTHIPKAAGSSIGKSLIGTDIVGHYPLRYLKEINPYFFEKAFKFTFSRNPINRLASAYNFLKQGGKGKWDSWWIKNNNLQNVCLDEFVINHLNSEIIYKIIHLVPQYEFICKDDKIITNYISKVEEIDQGIKYLSKDKGITIELTVENKTKPYEIELSKAAEDKIKKIYAKDYSILEY